jgi:WD40 repeat protein
MTASNIPDWQQHHRETSNSYVWISVSVFACLILCVSTAFCGLGMWTIRNGTTADSEPEAEEVVQTPQEGGLPDVTSDPRWKLMIHDEFEDNEHNWDIGPYQNDNVTMDRSIDDGKYIVDFESNSSWDFWSFSEGQLVEDFVASVEIKHLEGNSLEGFGLVLRAYENDFYLFRIDEQGNVGFYIFIGEKYTPLMERTSSSVKAGDVNEITVHAQGSHFTFYVNGEEISSIDDDRLPRGYVGILTSTSGQPESLLDFNSNEDSAGYYPSKFEIDNFKIWVPAVGDAALEALAPEEGHIVFVSDADGNPEIYSISTNGTQANRLTNNEADDTSPKWSPDGERIAFVSTRDGNPEIYVMNADGSGLTRVTDDPANDLTPAWSPNGESLVFSSDRDGNHEIYVRDLNTEEETRLTDDPANDIHPDWSSNGNVIIYKTTQHGSIRICILDVDTHETSIVSVKNPAADNHPAFSGSGERFLYETSLLQGGIGIAVSELDARNNLEIVEKVGFNMWPTWSPDDEQIAFVSDRNGQIDIYVIRVEGGAIYQLTDDDAKESEIDWTAN